MDSLKKRLLILLNLILIILIVILAFVINKKRSSFIVSVNPISKRIITKSKVSPLKYYYEPKPNTVDLTEVGQIKASRHINADGLIDRFDYPINKPNNVFRIIALGDSFTAGLEVDTDKNWSEILEDSLNKSCIKRSVDKFKVINLAVEGYDIQYSLERYKIKGQKYSPDLIL